MTVPTADADATKPNLRRRLATSRHPLVIALRRTRTALLNARLPAPHWVLRLYRMVTLVIVRTWMHAYRFFVCEPLFRAACAKVGRRMHTGFFLHFVQGPGQIELGDDVWVDGKCSFMFAHRFSDAPTLRIGDRTKVSYGSTFVVAKEISIGSDCLIAAYVHIFDSSGHPVDPTKRRAGLPPEPDEVKPVRIGNNVWVGTGAMIFPGVQIGDGAVISAHSVVVNSVPPNTLVGGYPARKVQELTPEAPYPDP